MLNLDPNQIEEHFAQYAIFQMKFAAVKFKFDMQALLYSHFHLNWSILIGFRTKIGHYELLLFGDSIVVSIDDHIDVVTKPNYNTIVALKLFFNPVKLKIILNAICKRTGRLKISNNLKECRILILIVQVFYDANEFYSYAHMINLFTFV